MKTYTIHPQDVDDGLITGGYAICLNDGKVIEKGARHNKQHTLMPIPEYEEAFAENERRFLAWLDALTGDEIAPDMRETLRGAIQSGELTHSNLGVIDWLEGHCPQLVGNFEGAVIDAIDERREQFCKELNSQAPEGVTFVFAEPDEDEEE